MDIKVITTTWSHEATSNIEGQHYTNHLRSLTHIGILYITTLTEVIFGKKKVISLTNMEERVNTYFIRFFFGETL